MFSSETDAYNLVSSGRIEEAKELLRALAEGGSSYSLLTLGKLYENDGDVEVARSFYDKAASLGEIEAYRKLGIIACEAGRVEDAIAAFEEAAKRGDLPSKYRSGALLRDHVPSRKQEASKWLQEAAKEGHAYALRDLSRARIAESKSFLAKTKALVYAIKCDIRFFLILTKDRDDLRIT